MSFFNRKEDGRAEILISEDGMRALCVLHPAQGGGNEITIDYMQLLVEQAEIAVELDWNLISGKILEAERARRKQEFVLATGIEPGKSIPAHIKLKKRFFIAATTGIMEAEEKGGRVDYRQYSPYTIVTRDERIGRHVSEMPGNPGRNVCGREIAPQPLEFMKFQPGSNIYEKEGLLFAAIDGLFVCKDGIFSVEPELSIPGDVDFHTGHIEFPADVLVKGSVKRGFHVTVSGNFICGQTIEASRISVGGKLETAEGIIGYGNYSVKVGAEVRCKFIENVFLECRGRIFVKDSIFNSRVFTMDCVELGKEGRILGGQVYSVNGISAQNIGNEMGLYGELHAGENFVIARRIAEYKKKLVRLGLKQETLNQLVSMGRIKEESLNPGASQIEEIQGKINEAALELDKNREARITVRGDIYPGILISICGFTYRTVDKISKTVFYLEENQIKQKGL